MAISDELRKLVDPNNECCCEHCLSNKCEEWAVKQENCFAIVSGKLPDNYFCCVQYKFAWIGTDDFEKYFRTDTKSEAIFKACEWILKDKR